MDLVEDEVVDVDVPRGLVQQSCHQKILALSFYAKIISQKYPDPNFWSKILQKLLKIASLPLCNENLPRRPKKI
jgi:hypothetical protein